MIRKIIITFFILISAGGYLVSGARFVDPEIPDGERIIYSSITGEKGTRTEEEVSVKEEQGEEIYEFVTKSEESDQIIKMTKSDMSLYSVQILQKNENAVIERKANLLENNAKLKADEKGLLDFNGLYHVLRGYPFDAMKSVKIVLLGARSFFPLVVENEGQEVIRTKDRAIGCYKLRIGVSGIRALRRVLLNFLNIR